MDKVDEILKKLGEIEIKLDYISNTGKDHEDRIRIIERGYWKIIGGASIVSLVLTWLLSKLGL